MNCVYCSEFSRNPQAHTCQRMPYPEIEARLDRLRESLELANTKLKDISDTFYGQGLELTNWHKNGTTEPIDSFFESNDWEPVEPKKVT